MTFSQTCSVACIALTLAATLAVVAFHSQKQADRIAALQSEVDVLDRIVKDQSSRVDLLLKLTEATAWRKKITDELMSRDRIGQFYETRDLPAKKEDKKCP